MPDKMSIKELMNKGLIKKGDDPSLVVEWIPTGIPQLDDLLGGGLPRGRAIINYGPESNGKTLLGQYAVAAVQKSERPSVLYLDMERSYDEAWWKQSGVDTEKLMVVSPATAEEAIDIAISAIYELDDLGMIFLDSIAAMTPEPEMNPDASASDKSIGLQARAVTLMYRKMHPIMNKIVFLATNQMRESVGVYDELKALPGGRAQRHYSHIILKTVRESWIKEGSGNKRANVGFVMEITSKKNKLAKTADGTSITLPFMFDNQLDWTMSYIQEALRLDVIVRAGPYYKFAGKSFMGMDNLRNFFLETPDKMQDIKQLIEA